MNYKAEYIENELTKKEKDSVWRILCLCDGDFFPKLSARESSVQKKLDLNGGEGDTKALPHTYFNELIKQKFILAKDEAGEVVAFMSFRPDYICDALEGFGKSLYITTVCVDPSFRKQGIMKKLYETMETVCPEKLGESKVSTRTWSTNHIHIRELSNRGYQEVAVLKDDRGKGIDTIYFGKALRT